MDVKKFFARLGETCEEGKCKRCYAHEFCFTAPASMTDEIISRVLNRILARMMDGDNYGEWLKTNRKERGLTQAQLAKQAGVSLMSIRRYESGERTPRFEERAKIAKAMGMSMEVVYKELFVAP